MGREEWGQGFVLGSYQGYLIPPSLVQLCNSTSTKDHRIGKRQFGLELGTTRLFCGERWVEISDPFPSRAKQGLWFYRTWTNLLLFHLQFPLQSLGLWLPPATAQAHSCFIPLSYSIRYWHLGFFLAHHFCCYCCYLGVCNMDFSSAKALYKSNLISLSEHIHNIRRSSSAGIKDVCHHA